MEAAASGRRPGQELLGRRGGSHRNSKGICPKADLSFAEKGEDARSCERQRKAGTTEPREGSQSTGGRGPASLLGSRVWHDGCEGLPDTREWAGLAEAAGPDSLKKKSQSFPQQR